MADTRCCRNDNSGYLCPAWLLLQLFVANALKSGGVIPESDVNEFAHVPLTVIRASH